MCSSNLKGFYNLLFSASQINMIGQLCKQVRGKCLMIAKGTRNFQFGESESIPIKDAKRDIC